MAVNRFTQSIRAKIIRIGNSQGIRIPQALLQQLRLGKDVEMSVQDDQLVIRAARTARSGWEERFARTLPAESPAREDEPQADETEWEGAGLEW